MTFYNVISALLFLGTIRALLVAVDAWRIHEIWMGSTLTLLVFNDMLSTSHLVESERSVNYNNTLMALDLLNFFLLAAAMIALNPSQNLFDLNLPNLAAYLDEAAFWGLLAVYWGALMYWTYYAGIRREIAAYAYSVVIPILYLIIAVIVSWDASGGIAQWCRAGVTIYLLVYLIWIRPRFPILTVAPK